MRYAVFGDVHGNLPALELFLKSVEKSVDGYICTGDIVNYGPWSNECVERIRTLQNLTCVSGNHEQIFLDKDSSKLSPLVREFTEITLKDFDEFDWISSLPVKSKLNDFEICHTLEGRYIFSDTQVEILGSAIIGHSHQQFIRELPGGRLVNPGSLGQNRKVINLLEYMIYDSRSKVFEPFRMKYPFEKLLEEMKKRRYSQRCIDYYLSKEII